MHGTCTFTNKRKSNTIKWKGSVVPKGKKTMKCAFELSIDKKTMHLHADVGFNPNSTANIHGEMVDIHGKTHRIDADGVNLKDERQLKALFQ